MVMAFLALALMVLVLSSASEGIDGGGGGKGLKAWDSPVTCASNNTACVDDPHCTNCVDVQGDIPTIQECRQLCYDSNLCEYLTYYGPNSYPFREVCFLHRQCDQTHSCTECVSETRGCYRTCGRNFVGVIDENLVEGFFGVKKESDCQELCYKSSNCKYYTYFFKEDANSETCVLLSHLVEPLEPCEHCASGPVDCNGMEDCSFALDGNKHKFYMFTEAGNDIDLYIPLSFGPSECLLRVLVVGGGGKGHYSGGGSGYLQYFSVNLVGPTLVTVSVGKSEQASNVTINGETIMAEHGQDANSNGYGNGGDGYSGGGAWWCHCDGGYNGDDGKGCDNGMIMTPPPYIGGHGSGQDVTKFSFDNFVLSPANAGKSCYCRAGGNCGGGGGGILINGDGYDDNGYGGGGCGYQDDGYLSAPGVVLVELIG